MPTPSSMVEWSRGPVVAKTIQFLKIWARIAEIPHQDSGSNGILTGSNLLLLRRFQIIHKIPYEKWDNCEENTRLALQRHGFDFEINALRTSGPTFFRQRDQHDLEWSPQFEKLRMKPRPVNADDWEASIKI